jgi:hypothetical protein
LADGIKPLIGETSRKCWILAAIGWPLALVVLVIAWFTVEHHPTGALTG